MTLPQDGAKEIEIQSYSLFVRAALTVSELVMLTLGSPGYPCSPFSPLSPFSPRSPLEP